MLKPVAIALALALALPFVPPVHAEEQGLEISDSGQIAFVMPSGNIGCLYTPEGGTDAYMPADGGPELICERIEPSYVTVVLGAQGAPLVDEDPDEQSCCGADNVFAYGNVIELDGFHCLSATTGLSCENEEGYGFSMARAAIDIYQPAEATDDEESDGDNEDAEDND